jgi:hypothetical protein
MGTQRLCVAAFNPLCAAILTAYLFYFVRLIQVVVVLLCCMSMCEPQILWCLA